MMNSTQLYQWAKENIPVAVSRYCSTEEYEVIKQELEIVFRIPVQLLAQESYMH